MAAQSFPEDASSYSKHASPNNAPPSPPDSPDSAAPPNIATNRSKPRHHPQRSANDVRLKPAAPEVINGLIASFPAHPIPAADIYPDYEYNHEPALTLPLPQSLQRAASYGVDIFTPATDQADANGTYKYTVAQAADDPAGQQDSDEEVAMPPVVRTARPPSGLSKVTAPRVPRFHRPFRNLSGSSNTINGPRLSPTIEHPDPMLHAVPVAGRPQSRRLADFEEEDEFDAAVPANISSGARSFGRVEGSSRPSVDSSAPQVMRNAGPPSASSRSFRTSASRTGRLFPSFGTPSVTSSAQQTNRTTTQNSGQSTARPSMDDLGKSSATNGINRSDKVEEHSTRKFGGIFARSAPASRGRRDSLTIADGPPEPPGRTSSMRYQERPAFVDQAVNKTLSERTSREHIRQGKQPTSRKFIVPDQDDDNDVLNRINELKAAKERRERELQQQQRQQNHGLAINGMDEATEKALAIPRDRPVTPTRLRPPTSSSATRQIDLARDVDEVKVAVNGLDTHENVQKPLSLRVASPEVGHQRPATADEQDVDPNRPFRNIAKRTAYTPQRSVRQSLDVPLSGRQTPQQQAFSPNLSPTLSRSNSRTKKWSRPTSSSVRSGLNTPRQYPALMEEARPSFDSINESVQEYLSHPRLSQKILLGRRSVCFSEVGDPKGSVVICCVGMGVTRYITTFYDELAASLKLRLITLDRPGVGDSEPHADGYKPPLSWPDDVQAVCDHLHIQRFALLAHSAGAIYALATATRMREQVCGVIHLLAPWLPPSQMTTSGLPSSSPARTGSLPRSQRFLRLLPTPLLRFTSSFNMGGNLRTPTPKQPSKARKSTDTGYSAPASMISPRPSMFTARDAPPMPSAPHSPNAGRGFFHQGNKASSHTQLPSTPRIEDVDFPSDHSMTSAVLSVSASTPASPGGLSYRAVDSILEDPEDRRRRFDSLLTPAIWQAANRNANPAIDLLVCLERNQPIGFRYVDVDAGNGIIIHHGSKDARIPPENVRWLGKIMHRCEVRVVEGEGHNLMSSAGVMGGVLAEMSQELGSIAKMTSTDR